MLNKITGVTAAAVVGIAATVAGAQSAAVQWKVEDGGNGHWYQRVARESRSWSTLREFAVESGGHLATLTSPPEKTFLVNNVLAGNFCFIGGFQLSTGSEPAGDWRWVTGEAVTWTNWAVGEPNNYEPSVNEDVMAVWGDGLWADVNEDAYLTPCQHGLFEWSADCNNDNIIDYGQCHNGTLADYNSNNIPDCCERGNTCVAGNYPVQWKVSDGGNGHWYRTVGSTCATWVASLEAARSVGGDLASISSQGENDFVFQASLPIWTTNGGGPWLGGYQDVTAADYVEPSGGWRWSSGEPWMYTNWNCTNPSNTGGYENVLNFAINANCGSIPFPAWNDASDQCNIGYMTEWSGDCNNDNIVDYGQILNGQLADSNTNGVPDICEQPQCGEADITNNQIIDGADLGAMLASWGPVNPVLPQADINRDGDVNGADIGILLSFWGPCP
jgi:hypothetical protein